MSRSTRNSAFAVSQLAIVLAVTVAAADGLRHASLRRALPEAAEQPLVIRPLYNDPRVVGDQQLLAVLNRLTPPSMKTFPKVNHVDHALRFWGLEASFAAARLPSGTAMREFLVNDRFFREQSGGRARSLMNVQRDGVSFRTQEGRNTSSHADHTLATLAEIGTPLSFKLKTPAGPREVRTALAHALKQFSIDQPEYEWSAITFLLYQVDQSRWYSSDGHRVTWDRIADRLMRQRMGQGCCYGGHRLYTLAALIRVDSERQLLTPEMRERVLDHLADATRRLIANQNEQGAMDGAWPGAPILKNDKLSTLGQQLLSTGHALEWWAIAPEEVQPPRETVVRAGQWLSRRILEMSDRVIEENYTFLTHAGRALVLWRGVFPAEFLRDAGSQTDSEE